MGQYMKIGIGRSTIHIPAVAEQVGSTPKQFYTACGLFLFGIFNQSLQTPVVFIYIVV
jgi:hypothetical protein